MDKPKAKNKPSAAPDQDRHEFRGVWILSQMTVLSLLWMFLFPRADRLVAFQNFGVFAMVVAGMAFIMLAASTLQQRTAERFLKHSFEGWAVTSILGVIFSVGAFGVFQRLSLLASALALLLPTAWLQMLWLWQHVQSAWLWMLVNVLGALMLTLPFREYDTSTQVSIRIALIIVPLQAVIQTMVMSHLWTQPKEKDKPRGEPDTQMLNDHASLQRLSLTENAETASDEETPEEPYDQDKSQKRS